MLFLVGTGQKFILQGSLENVFYNNVSHLGNISDYPSPFWTQVLWGRIAPPLPYPFFKTPYKIMSYPSAIIFLLIIC
jgi:hypothetical protein